MKEIDFPAGHSMDTEWFAVDKDGNIAAFLSSDSGFVAASCRIEGYFYEFLRLNSKPLSKYLREFTLSQELVEAILSKCKVENLKILFDEIAEFDGFLFTGFFVLAEGYKWEDLQFEKHLKNEENKNDFVFQISHQHRLYYINDIYNLKQAFQQAVQAEIIISCVDSLWDIFEGDIEKINAVHFGLYYYENQYSYEPYVRKFAPKHALNVKHLSQELKENFATFKQVSFEKNNYVQPYEFLPCNIYDTYILHDDVSTDSLHKYASVKLSDNETIAYCKIFLKDLLKEEIGVGWACGKCEDTDILKSSNSMMEAFIDYPPVFVIDTRIEFRDYDYISKLRSEIISRIGLTVEHCYITSCIKCVNDEKKYDEAELKLRFKNCFDKMETEIKIIRPSFVICVGETTFNILKEEFNIKIEQYKSAVITEITIAGSTLPILLTDCIDGNHEKLNEYSKTIPKLIPEIPIETSRVKKD